MLRSVRGTPRVCSALAATVCGVLIALVVASSDLRAQISPGPLAKPHASLEGPRNCTQCHGSRREPTTQRCLACHREIAWLQQQGQGFHARRDARGTCSSCHPDHAGRDFALIQWPDRSPERFDHAQGTGYALDGSHATAKCTACHTPRLRTSPAAALSPRRGTTGWVGLETSCTSCHTDPHRGTLDGACTRCHDTGRWKDVPTFDHARTRYPLTGKHDAVECAACHTAPRLEPSTDSAGRPIPVFRPVPFKDCAACHIDPHQGRLAGTCTRCHVTSGFRTIDRAAFDHDRTRYPLRGKHATVACASCHGGSSTPTRARAATITARATNRGAAVSEAVARPAFQACTACHTDAHGGQLAARPDRGACTACHSVDGWRPSTFALTAHATLRLPLDGAHATVACASCHAVGRRGLPPLPESAAAGAARFVARPPETTCAQCHRDPHAWRRPGAAATCIACHTTRAFRPTTMSASAHASTGFALEGAHLAVPCVGCHETMTRPAATSTLVAAAPGVAPLDLRQSRATCASCHSDPHAGRFTAPGDAAGCERCHSVRAFTPATGFDHARDGRFPLEGAHARVPCASCHRESSGATAGGATAGKTAAGATPGSPTRYGGLSAACESCHLPSRDRQRPRP